VSTSVLVKVFRTLAADNFDSHARVVVPVNGLEAKEAGDDWLFEVRMFHAVRV